MPVNAGCCCSFPGSGPHPGLARTILAGRSVGPQKRVYRFYHGSQKEEGARAPGGSGDALYNTPNISQQVQ